MRYLILVDDNLCGFFGSLRGLRHKDTLSPMLFILVIEALSRMMDRAVMGEYLKGFNAAVGEHGTISISYLVFANDTLIFCY